MIYKDINGVRIEIDGAKRFTGILDRNKKEIFEDDIILMDTEDFLGKYKVIFTDGQECNFCGGTLSNFNLELIEKVDVDGYKYIEDSYFDVMGDNNVKSMGEGVKDLILEKKVEHLEENKYLIGGEKVELVSAFDSENCEGCYFLGDSDVFCSKCTAKHISIFKKL